MRIRQFLCAMAMCGVGTVASAQTLLQVPIGVKGTFTVELTECTTPTTGTATYVKNTVTGLVTLKLPQLQCTSTSNFATLTGLPPEIYAAGTAQMSMAVNKGTGVVLPGYVTMMNNAPSFFLAVWDGTRINAAGFIIGQAKGTAAAGWTVTYQGNPDT